MAGDRQCPDVFPALRPFESGKYELFSEEEPFYDWTDDTLISAYSDKYANGNWIQYEWSINNGKITQDWLLNATRHIEDLQSQAVVDCATNPVPDADEIVGYDMYTKEDIEYLNNYFEELQRLEESALATGVCHPSSIDQIADALPIPPQPDTPHKEPKTVVNFTENTSVIEAKRSTEAEAAPVTSEPRRPAEIHVVKRRGIPLLQFPVQVESVEDNDSVICILPAVRAVVESSIASAFPTYCLGCPGATCMKHGHDQRESQVIELSEVQPRQLVLVSSPEGKLLRGLVEDIHDEQNKVPYIGVGFVDGPGGIYTKRVFKCPKEVAAIPCALLRVKPCHKDGQGNPVSISSGVNLKELRKGETRSVLCHAMEGNTAFGVFGETV